MVVCNLSKTGGIDFMYDFVLKRNMWDVLEDVLHWPLMAIIVGVTLPIAAVNFFFFGGWLDVVPTPRERKRNEVLSDTA